MISGEIVLVPFPFTDLSSVKTRLALVLVDSLAGGDIIICAISSKATGKLEVKVDNQSLIKGELPVVSFIKYGKLVTLDKRIIRKSVAKVKNTTLAMVKNRLTKLINKI